MPNLKMVLPKKIELYGIEVLLANMELILAGCQKATKSEIGLSLSNTYKKAACL